MTRSHSCDIQQLCEPLSSCITVTFVTADGSTARYVNETFTSASGLEVPITQLAVDSGYAATEVYQWARKQGHRVVVIKGDSRAAALLGNPAPIEIGPLGAKIKRGVKVWPVNSGMAKEELYRWLRLERPTDEDIQQGQSYPPGYCHFPRYSEEYFKQITAEQLVTKILKGYGRHEWQMGWLRKGVGELIRQAGLQLMDLLMQEEVRELAGERSQRQPERTANRWASERGFCVIGS
jgi:hypothetical protein